MPIDFRCAYCGASGQVENEAGTPLIACPRCGKALATPAGEGAQSGPDNLPPALPSEALPPPVAALPPTVASAEQSLGNPYQSPQHSISAPRPLLDKSGPPWEYDGPSVGSFIATVRQLFGSQTAFFHHMSRTGGLVRPIAFAVIGGSIGTVIGVAVETIIEFNQAGMFQMGGPDEVAIEPFTPVIGLVCLAPLIPLIFILAVFLYGGMYHVSLMLLRGAQFPFETTLRVVAYATGAASLLAAIPVGGEAISGIAQLIFIINGLSQAHEISGGKATAAVLAPVVLCVGAVIAAAVALNQLGVQ
jgi:hypothetical protein